MSEVISKIAIIADLHIMNYMRLNENKASMERFLYDMAEVVKPDRIVIVGDLVHAKNQTSPEADDLAGWFFEECAKIAITIFILGNHDGIMENKDRLDSITPIVNRMKNPRINFYKKSGIYQDENVNWVVFGVLDDDYPNVTEKDPNQKYYGLYHGIIQGASTDTNYTFVDGGSQVKLFENLDATFCGDIHKRFVGKNNLGNPVIMVGSFTQQNYMENLTEHGYCVFNTEDGTYFFENIESNIKYMTFRIKDIEDIHTGNEELLNKI